ncbi:MAG: protein kinase, partial [Planctomycetaceae bacterium]|nr:protein kinase [Planctomycetaceae bacterium]
NPPKGYPLPPDVPLVKVADFGLAFLAEQGEDKTRLTSENSTIGSPNYLAPEQLESETVDHRVDIYGLGATLYHLLSGEAPFKAKSLNQIISNKLSGRFRPLGELNPDISSETVALVNKMLAVNPEDRFADYATLWQRVSEIMGNSTQNIALANTILSRNPLTSKSSSAADTKELDDTILLDAKTVRAERIGSESRSKKGLVWGGLLLLGLLVGGSGYAWRQAFREPPRAKLETGPGVVLFSGVDLAGWKTVQGQVHPGKGEEGEYYLVVENQGMTEVDLCQKMAQISEGECPDAYAVELNVDLVESKLVLIGFAQSDAGKLWGLRVTDEQAALVQYPYGAVMEGNISVFASVPIEKKGPMNLKLVRDQEYWFLFLNGAQIAWVPLDETVQTNSASLSLSSAGGSARFSDLMAFPLREPRESGSGSD